MKGLLANIYKSAAKARRQLFAKQILKTTKVDSHVISVGNLTAGGTGKTPVVDFLVAEICRRNRSVGIVSRGYKGSYEGVKEVELSNLAAKIYGDEPTILKMRNQKVPIFVGRKRVEACLNLLKAYPVDFIVADDAYQHMYLHRDLNILLIDASEELANYEMLPKGRLREPIDQVSRADLVLLTKVNLVSNSQLTSIREFLRDTLNRYDLGTPIVEVRYLSEKYYSLDSLRESKLSDALEKKSLSEFASGVGLVSGIAKPEVFEASVRNQGVRVNFHQKYSDHYSYSSKDFKIIEDLCKKSKVDKVLVTEKDAVKMLSWHPQGIEIYVVGLELEFNQEIGRYIEIH